MFPSALSTRFITDRRSDTLHLRSRKIDKRFADFDHTSNTKCMERSGLPFIGRERYLEESYVRQVIPSLRSLELRQTDVSADSVRVPSWDDFSLLSPPPPPSPVKWTGLPSQNPKCNTCLISLISPRMIETFKLNLYLFLLVYLVTLVTLPSSQTLALDWPNRTKRSLK